LYISTQRIFYYFVRRLIAAYQSRISYHILRNCVSVHEDKLLRDVRTDMFYSLIGLKTKLGTMLHGIKCWRTDALTFSYPLRNRRHRLQGVLRNRNLRAADTFCHFHVVLVADWVVLGHGVSEYFGFPPSVRITQYSVSILLPSTPYRVKKYERR
jgi:hypothetical protein